MRQPITATNLFFALALMAGATPAVAAPACNGVAARYHVSFVGDGRFDVAAEFAAPSSRWDLAHFPIAARPEAQSASVRDLKAFDANGREVPVRYVGEGGFAVPEGQEAMSIRYSLLADHDAVDWNIGAPGKDEVAAKFDKSYVFAGHAFFLLDWEMPRCPVTVDFDLPQGWHVTSPWAREGDQYRIEDSWGLGQNMFAMGEDVAEEVEVGGLTLNWLMDSKLGAVSGDIKQILSVLPGAYRDFWGEAPGSRFSVFFMSDYMSDGGAFWDSFALRFAVPLSAADRISWHHTLGHEVMHLWNSLGKKNGENVPELEWVNEGFTDYLTLKLMSQAGLIEPEMVEQRLANMVRRYVLAGRLTPDATLKTAGADKGKNWQAVYGGGAMVALLLDAELSRNDPDGLGRLLRSMRAQQGEGYDYERFMAVLDKETGGKGSEIVAWLDGRPSSADIVARIAKAGLDVSIFGIDEAYVRFASCDEGRCAPAFLEARTATAQ